MAAPNTRGCLQLTTVFDTVFDAISSFNLLAHMHVPIYIERFCAGLNQMVKPLINLLWAECTHTERFGKKVFSRQHFTLHACECGELKVSTRLVSLVSCFLNDLFKHLWGELWFTIQKCMSLNGFKSVEGH